MLHGSWKTSAGGIFGGGCMILGELSDFLTGAKIEGMTNGVFESSVIFAAFGIIYAAWNARDKDVTSEQQGIA